MKTYIQNRILQQTNNMPFALWTWKSKNTSIDWFICIYIHIHIYTHIYTYIYTHTYIYLCNTPKGLYTQFWIKSSVQTGMQNNSKISNVHHHEWTITAGCWANLCYSIPDRRVWVFALSHPGTWEALTPFKVCTWGLSPRLDHTTADAWLYLISLSVYMELSGHSSPGECFLASRPLKAKAAGVTAHVGTSWPGLAERGLGNIVHTAISRHNDHNL